MSAKHRTQMQVGIITTACLAIGTGVVLAIDAAIRWLIP